MHRLESETTRDLQPSGAAPVTRAVIAYRFATIAACGLSGGILVVSFAAIAIYIGNPWPWFEIVHESGDRTLVATIFFFEHTARELPLDVILGAASAASALFVLPLGRPADSSRGSNSRVMPLALGLALVVALIVGGTLWVGGLPSLYENLLQFPTRPGAPPEWGGHWRYHLLSHVMLMTVALGLGAVLIVLARGLNGKGNVIGLRVFRITTIWFAALTIVFLPNLEPFVDPVVIGHQVRESLTHVLVTVPAALAVCLLLGRDQWRAPDVGNSSIRGPLLAGAFGVLVGLFLLVSGLARSAASQGQSQSMAVLLFPHFFEHTFSYLVAALTAGLIFEWTRQRATP